ncbi:MAG TPA: tetratricopeptide repeat protein [Allosphingosinicella sp.]|jgi:tetratricopeptide (TPR) repeat protein
MRANTGMAAGGNGNARASERLRSWKEIAAFFGADERTVRRWERRGLPVHRIPGGARATVYADVPELKAWMQGRDPAAEGVDRTAPRKIAGGRGLLLVAMIVLAAGSVGFLASFRGNETPPAAASHEPPRPVRDLYLEATYEFERRTAASLERARLLYGQAIAADPTFAGAYVGLANSYLLLREFGTMADDEAYRRARDAAERALALDPNLAGAHAALAFVDFYGTQDWALGLRRFARAVQLDPGSARAHHWYATALLHAGRFDQALAEIDEAAGHDPSSRSIRADRALILFFAGRTEEGVAELRAMAASEPEFASPHAHLALIHLAQNRFEDHLREARIAAELRRDAEDLALVARGERGLAAGGPEGMLRALVAEQLRLRRSGRGSDYALAAAYARAGEKDLALRALEAARAGRDPRLVALRVDPMLRSLRGDPRFEAMVRRVGTRAER